MDYQGNTRKDKEPKPEKVIEKVVTGEVIQKPKSIGRKFKNIFLGGDLKMAASHVAGDVILPAIRNLMFDSIYRGTERVIFGDSSYRRRPPEYRPRVSYNNPFNRSMVDPRERPNLPDQPPHPYRQNRRQANDIVLQTRQEAEVVVERLIDIIEKYDVASLADLYDLLGWTSSHVDNKWGWSYLSNIEVRQIHEGFLIDLPPLEAL